MDLETVSARRQEAAESDFCFSGESLCGPAISRPEIIFKTSVKNKIMRPQLVYFSKVSVSV